MTSSRRITRSAAVAFGALALSVPAAQASPAYDAGAFAGTPDPAAAAPAPAPRVKRIDAGIDAGSLALGAGGGALVLTLVGLGSTAIGRRKHVAAGI